MPSMRRFHVTEWLCNKWAVTQEIESADYIVGLGSGILNDEEGELTAASKNVTDMCISLYRLWPGARGIILVGGMPWRHPQFSDAALMHKRLISRSESSDEPGVPSEKVVVLEGAHNTYLQTGALWRYLLPEPQAKLLIVCPRLQTRRLRALLKKRGLLQRAGIAPVDDGCEPLMPVERFRWNARRYLLHEFLASVHHKLHGWT
ncbi:MAG: hypothetical protein Kow0099_32640 [Candidatus Abyssubacteria bacterium]